MPTIAAQLEGTEKKINEYEKRLDSVQRTIRLGPLTTQERTNLEEEEVRLKKQIESQDKKRRELQKENWKSALVSVIILSAVFLLYKYFYPS